MSVGVVYRIMRCPAGHTWDAYGRWAGSVFVPDDLKQTKCPTCDATAVDLDGEEPERLA